MSNDPHPLTVACESLAQNAVALRVLYQDRNDWENKLLAVPNFGALIGMGKEFKWDRFWVRGEIIPTARATKSERRNLHRLQSGDYLKIHVTEKEKKR